MSKYLSYNSDQLEELFSSFLVDSWSYSKVTSFARNEKAFEKTDIYGEKTRRSASSVAGNAYHAALALYFENLSSDKKTSIVEMERIGFAYIDRVSDESWKLQKTTPTVEECKILATKNTTSLIKNFVDDIELYISELDEVLGVELRCDEWLTINGVDIPLPCHAAIDLIIRLKNGKIVIIDHKSKRSLSADKELAFIGGKQAITYVKCLESKTDHTVDEVWFIENKISKNENNSPQLKKFVIALDRNTTRLYEAMLYEPLKRMIEAVSDPDYVFLINDSDNFIDKEEMYEFWAKTMIAEVDDFNVAPEKQDIIAKRLKKIRDATLAAVNPKTISEFRKNAAAFIPYNLNNMDLTNSQKIEHILRTFGIGVSVAHSIDGYSSDTFLLDVGAGVKIANIMRYDLDIANALNASSVSIGKKLMVYKDRSYLSIETSKKRERDLLFDPKYLKDEKIPIGVNNFGETIYWNMNNHSTPHVLVCGATGSGKSISLISTIEYAKLAGVTDIIILDPKNEFGKYNGNGVRVFKGIEKIEEQMKLLVDEMQRRVESGYTSKTLVVFDEFADALASSRKGKALDIKEEVQVGYYAPKKDENGYLMDPVPKMKIQTVGTHKSLGENLQMLLQKGRSLGFRVIAATQRASVKVITGDTKVNFPVQICFQVPKEIDSKVVLDESGAELLAGMGDGLIRSPEYLTTVRFQGFYKP